MVSLGARRHCIAAVIGPCISKAAYEVGPEFEASFLAADPAAHRFFARPAVQARAHFDLPGFMLHRLSKAGIASAHWVGACTYAAPDDYFSYRRTTHRGEPDYGRQIAVITPPRR
jgi:polyphenol oxidase